MAEKDDNQTAEKPHTRSTSSGRSTAAAKHDDRETAASAVREVAQDQSDRVAIVSRTSTGEAHQSPGYEVIGLPDDASETDRAAAENRPHKG